MRSTGDTSDGIGPERASDGPSAVAPVVVGVDDSRLSLVATRLAALEAAWRNRPLRVVHSFHWDTTPDAPADCEPREAAEQLIAAATAAAAEAAPDVEVVGALTEGPTLTTLLRESGSAALLAIGDSGLHGDGGAVPGDTTSLQLAARAGCDVLVAREQQPPDGPVLIAVDGSDSQPGVLETGLREAACRGAAAEVVQVWPSDEPGDVPADRLAERERQLGEAVAAARREASDVAVSHRVLAGEPTDLLVDLSRRASLVVVGARGDQPWRGMLGEVSQGLLFHSPVPVVVVRAAHQIYVQA